MTVKNILKKIKKGINAIFEEERETIYYQPKVLSKEETRRMYDIFNVRKMYLMEQNTINTIENYLIPEIRREFLKETRLLISDKQARDMAINRFQIYLAMGKIDEMNNLIV